jgi:hypothetical protein
MDQEYRRSRSSVLPRDADIAAIVSLVTTIAIVGLWRLVG